MMTTTEPRSIAASRGAVYGSEAKRQSLLIDVDIQDPRWSAVVDDPMAWCREVISAVVVNVEKGPAPVEVSIVLHDDAAQRTLNKQYRAIDASTNVLSFPADMDANLMPPNMPLPLGDITLAYDTVANEALQAGKSFNDHFAHLLVHGMLHLYTYDHETEDEAEIMEGLEVKTLAILGISDPYSTID